MRRFSPYNYGNDNSIRNIDPDGMEVKPGDLFKTMDGAAIDFAKFYNGKSIINNQEYNSNIYTVVKDGVTYYSYVPSSNDNGTMQSLSPPVPAGTKLVGNAYTHDAAQPGVPAKENPNQIEPNNQQVDQYNKVVGKGL